MSDIIYTPANYSVKRRIDLYLMICEDKTLDRTALHVAAVLLLKHCNKDTAKTVPGTETIAKGMGRSTRTVTDGLTSLKVKWLYQRRRVGTSSAYEWNWKGLSAEDWQHHCLLNQQTSLPIGSEDKPADSNRKTSLPI